MNHNAGSGLVSRCQTYLIMAKVISGSGLRGVRGESTAQAGSVGVGVGALIETILSLTSSPASSAFSPGLVPPVVLLTDKLQPIRPAAAGSDPERTLTRTLLYAISYHTLAVHAARHAILDLITPWQYPPRLGMLFYILSRLCSIRRGLACFAISDHALAISAEAWHATLYLITPWQYPPRLGVLFYILFSLGSILRGLACYFLRSSS